MFTRGDILAVAVCLCVTAVVAQVPGFGKCPDIKTQETVDLNKYLGDWYEIEKFFAIFEAGKCIKAHYSLKDNGRINISNSDVNNGKTETAVGEGYRPDDSQQGKLSVRFAEASPYAKYWIIHTDYDTYSMVYSCTDLLGLAKVEFAWILSRNTTLDDTIKKQLEAELGAYGVDVTHFKTSDQTECPQ